MAQAPRGWFVVRRYRFHHVPVLGPPIYLDVGLDPALAVFMWECLYYPRGRYAYNWYGQRLRWRDHYCWLEWCYY